MRIILAHNFYQQPGGEDEVFRSEYELLASHGHHVTRFTMHNDDVKGTGRLKLLGATLWNGEARAELAAQVRRERAEVVHFHNTFPLMSPGVYSAVREAGAGVVQTLHNFRFVCPGALLYREGAACELCLTQRVPTAAVSRACYRGSRSATAAVVAMLATHRALGTYRRDVDVYIAPSAFASGKLAEGGIPREKLVVKPNFVHPDPGAGPGGGGYAIFVGRLSHEKGVEVLLKAWTDHAPGLPLKIVGDGPMAPQVRAAIAGGAPIEWLGRRPLAEVYEQIGREDVLVCPSVCYETFGRVAAEAFAKGTPVVASGHGAVGDVVDPGRTGRHFRPGDAADLADQVRGMLGDPAKLALARKAARAEFEAKYTGAINHEQLVAIYRRAIASARRPSPDAPDDSTLPEAA